MKINTTFKKYDFADTQRRCTAQTYLPWVWPNHPIIQRISSAMQGKQSETPKHSQRSHQKTRPIKERARDWRCHRSCLGSSHEPRNRDTQRWPCGGWLCRGDSILSDWLWYANRRDRPNGSEASEETETNSTAKSHRCRQPQQNPQDVRRMRPDLLDIVHVKAAHHHAHRTQRFRVWYLQQSVCPQIPSRNAHANPFQCSAAWVWNVC